MKDNKLEELTVPDILKLGIVDRVIGENTRFRDKDEILSAIELEQDEVDLAELDEIERAEKKIKHLGLDAEYQRLVQEAGLSTDRS